MTLAAATRHVTRRRRLALITGMMTVGAVTWLSATAQNAALPHGPVAHVVVIDDTTVECDAAGNWIRIYSTGTQQVPSVARGGMDEARKVAGERAVAQITRFLQQDTSSAQIVERIELAFARNGGGVASMPADAQHRLATSIVDVIQAYAHGTLKEVRFTSPAYDDQKKQVSVRVGLTRERAASEGGIAGGLTVPPPMPVGGAIRTGGQIKQPTLVKHVPPVYPTLAASARVQGPVVLDVIVGADGKVLDAKVVQSKPLLDQAAIDAVLQWEYSPTLVDGVAVPVLIKVTVNFTLK